MYQAFLFFLSTLLILACSLSGNDSPIPEREEIPAYRLDRNYRPEVSAYRVDEPPKIDGHLEEEVWQNAPLVGPLLQSTNWWI